MKNTSKLLATSIIIITLLLCGCVQEIPPEDGGTTDATMSYTTILISDAPSDNFSHINVTFSQIKIHKYVNDNDSGWHEFDMDPKTIDMLYLHTNNLSEELGVENLTVGNYSKLWIVVDSATGVLKETGENIIFDVPSGDLKIQQSFEIKAGNTSIDVELDLDRSVLYVPQGGVYKLRPQLGKLKINYDKDKEDDEEDDNDKKEFTADAGDGYTGDVNETIEFTGSAEDGEKPYIWFWEFGDGTNSTDQNPEHIYNKTGTYTAFLTVTDNDGNIATADASVEIKQD